MVWLNLSGDFLVTFCWSGSVLEETACVFMSSNLWLEWQQQKTLELHFLLIVATFLPWHLLIYFLLLLFLFFPLLSCVIISLQWKFDQSWCCILLSPSMLGFFVTIISSAKCDVFVLIFQTKVVPRNVLHVSCCFLHTLVYITFTSLFSIVCAKTEQFNGLQRYPLNWWFWYDKYLIRSHLRASTCALRLSAWQSTWTLFHL